jgi:hypothetical protein
MAKGVAEPIELIQSLADFGSQLPPEVVNWRYTIEGDWSGDPGLFFWITISDEAAQRDRLSDVSRRIHAAIEERLNPFGEWGLIPYVSLRSRSEQDKLQEPLFG